MRVGRSRRLLMVLGAVAVIGVASTAAAPATKGSAIMVYKTPTCGCCAKWVEHLRKAGFEVTVRDMPDLTDLKSDLGVTPKLASCHTAVASGYVIEGHVPADLVQKLLKEKPANVAGLAAPGMPMGSPGMEGPVKDNYDVVAFDKSGKTTVYAKR